ncbi:MAG: fumarylacetoacetate hydrolase family protein [Syntrophales bacterium]|jgi:2-keto-4-pentenoate hydratase/2-oxohepta-3-ene-1,7-dioic acid hydratase in catechol pathway
MKIIRFLSDENYEMCGLYEPELVDQALVIRGDLFGDFEVTSKVAGVGTILPPIYPCNILALGLNYRQHADETSVSYPEIPILFLKATTSVIGHMSSILLPQAGPANVDYEAELAVIIGKTIKNVSRSEAMDSVWGYTCANDVSARDWQIEKQKKQWARGKSFDTFCPLGPYLVTRDEIPDPQNLRIRTVLNGRTVQDSNTHDMIFDIPAIISDLSRSMTLLPGTVILTGTPEGVGFTRQPPIYLQDGDVVTIEIEGIGQLTNPVKREDQGDNVVSDGEKVQKPLKLSD